MVPGELVQSPSLEDSRPNCVKTSAVWSDLPDNPAWSRKLDWWYLMSIPRWLVL